MTACAEDIRPSGLSRDPFRELLEAWRGGDPSAFDRLYGLTAPRLASYCLLLTGQEAEAQDLFQDAWRQAVATQAGYREEGSFQAWLAAIARNLWINRCQRARAGRRALERYAVNLSKRNPACPDEAEILRDLLSRLRPEEQEAALLYDLQGLTLRETAGILEIPLSTLRDRLAKAHERLAGLLKPS